MRERYPCSKTPGTTVTSAPLSDGARTAGTPADTASTSSGRLPRHYRIESAKFRSTEAWRAGYESARHKRGSPTGWAAVLKDLLVVLWFVLSGTAAWLTFRASGWCVQLHALMQIVARRRAFFLVLRTVVA